MSNNESETLIEVKSLARSFGGKLAEVIGRPVWSHIKSDDEDIQRITFFVEEEFKEVHDPTPPEWKEEADDHPTAQVKLRV